MMLKPGIYPDLSNKAYHADSALGSTGMSWLKKSAAEYQYKLNHPEEKNTYMFGDAYHCYNLERDLFDKRFEVVNKGGYTIVDDITVIPVSNKTSGGFDDITQMAKALQAHPIASALLSGGEPEVSYFWKHKLGFMCKCRPDYRKGTILIDLKSTTDASPEGFSKALANFGYVRQASHYLDGVAACGVPVEDFVIIAQEKKPPYAIGIYRLQDDNLYLAHEENKLIYQKYEQCLSTNKWEGYSTNIEPISLPYWYVKNAKI